MFYYVAHSILDGRATVYRLVTSVLSGAGFISLFFGLMSLNQVGPKLERSLGDSPEHSDVLLICQHLRRAICR